MDTRFWGPSGWKLLHLIAFEYSYSAENALHYAHFLETIPYILPCKYCRSSLTDYYKEHPYWVSEHNREKQINPTLDLSRWMYTIHNCVNHKLRTQGLYTKPNPSYQRVKQEYASFQRISWNQQLTQIWDFLFSVAYHHPNQAIHSSPMPECPKTVQNSNACDKNKWNVLPLKERIRWFKRFWVYLPAVLPGEMGKQWQYVEKRNPPVWKTQRSTLAWLWRMRCQLDTGFKDPYTSICHRMKEYTSDCKGKTCRRRKYLSNKSKKI